MLLELAQGVDETSGAYQFGRLLGMVAIVVLIVLLVRALVNRNK